MRIFLIKVFFCLVISFCFFSCGLKQWLPDTSEGKMVEALQEALVLGSKTAALNLGDTSCVSKTCAIGYLGNKLVEIAVPDTVNKVLAKIEAFTNSIPATSKPLLQTMLGTEYSSILNLGKYKDSIKIALNRGAEKAAPGSVNVFKNAIYGMSFDDARGLLRGDSTAATSYLSKTTYNSLQSSFAPIIKEPLDLLNPNKFWKPIASSYNSFVSAYNALGVSNLAAPPYSALPEDISKYLAEYATGKALDGLFLMVGKQETKLRADPWGTVRDAGDLISDSTGELLGEVFSKAKNDEI